MKVILGPPKSGKSLFAEALMAAIDGSKAYVGTLPGHQLYAETIREHRKRRPSDWALIELLGRPDPDAQVLERAVNDFDGILLDGLSFYVYRVLALFGYDPDWVDGLGETIAGAAEHGTELLLVDQPAGLSTHTLHRLVMLQLHRRAILSGNELYYASDGAVRRINAAKAVSTDLATGTFAAGVENAHENSETDLGRGQRPVL